MDNDPGILCINHCDRDIFVINFPEKCPLCERPFSSSSYPFRIPYPFVRASQHPCSIILKPTNGNFLNDYRNTDDLHIGVTDSCGRVYEYSESGLQHGLRPGWEQCLVVPGLTSDDLQRSSRAQEWDLALQEQAANSQWTPQRYEEGSHNCYTFVLAFLRSLPGLGELSSAARDKMRFCERVLLPHTGPAAKYITVFRRVASQGYFVQTKA